ncbi:hypothetical protein F5Y16DRAFT_75486 [Xylariaceae sp. FL0255]|nr:hypothetical protein F5Y16DRAFT_75486 [Xylariaceae sp. FL0255]
MSRLLIHSHRKETSIMVGDPFAALPMYDWPERRSEVNRQWADLRDRFRAKGIVAPDQLVRRNSDMPAVPGGISNSDGQIVAPDPASLPPEELYLPSLWRHPALLLGQTCWGPMRFGLDEFVDVLGQQDYTGVEGGDSDLYSSAIVARRTVGDIPAPSNGKSYIALGHLKGKRFIRNSEDSMSGYIGLTEDLEEMGSSISIFHPEILESGGHRQSIIDVAQGKADVAAIDCLTWELAKRFEPAASSLAVIGWTARRKGLPFIASKEMSPRIRESEVLAFAKRSKDGYPLLFKI